MKAALHALLLAALIALPARAAAQPIYKWVDEKGVTHFSEKPPEGVGAERLEPRTSPPRGGGAPPAAPTDWRQKEREFQERQLQQREREVKQEKQTEQERQRCLRAQNELNRASRASQSFRINEKGERVYLDDAERDARLARLREAVRSHCK